MLQIVCSSLSFAKMIFYYSFALLVMMEIMVASGFRFGGGDALSMNYYAMSCPLVEGVVRDNVNQALDSDPTLAGPLLRMFFHDCWIQGCDASILIDSTKDNTAEKDSPGNLSLRGYELIDDIKNALEEQCPGTVSCADIVTMVARDAVFLSGGPVFDIPKGRKDGTRSKVEDTIKHPSPSSNSSDLLKTFSQRGFTDQDLVALSGGHTLGVARCSSFKGRLANVDPDMDSDFTKTLSKTCAAGDTAEQPFDATKNTFDNLYFLALQSKMGLLNSDQTLFGSPSTLGFVKGYAMNQARFFFDFQQAMIKMSRLDVKDGSKGEVRSDCRKIN